MASVKMYVQLLGDGTVGAVRAAKDAWSDAVKSDGDLAPLTGGDVIDEVENDEEDDEAVVATRWTGDVVTFVADGDWSDRSLRLNLARRF